MKRKIFSILLAGIMIVGSVTGCGKNSSSSSASGQEEEPMTIQVNVRDTDKVIADKRTAVLEEMFNVKFDFVACNLNEITEKNRVWVASGDMPEVMWMDHKVSRTNEVKEWIEAGAFKAFPEDFEEKYPNLAAVNNSIESNKTLIVDGKQYIYLAPRGTSEFDDISACTFYYRADWAEKLGMYQEEYTWDEMVELIKAFIEKDPGGNGAGKTIGMVGCTWAFPGFVGMQQCEPYWNSYKLVDGEYVWGASLDSTVQGIVEAKRLYDEGIIWKDQPLITSDTDAWARYQSGQSGIVYGNMNTLQIETVMMEMLKANPDLDITKACKFMKVKTPDGKICVEKTEDYYGGWGFSQNISDEKQARFLEIMDYIASEEGQNMYHFGIEGEDFEVKDGEIELLWEKDENGKYISPFESGSDRLFSFVELSDGVSHTLPSVMQEARDSRMEQIEYFTNNQDLIYADIDYDLNAFSAPNKDKYSSLGTEVSDKVIELMLSSSTDTIEEEYRKWLKDTQPKADSVLKELNEEYLK